MSNLTRALFAASFVLLLGYLALESVLLIAPLKGVASASGLAAVRALPLLLLGPWLWRGHRGGTITLAAFLMVYFCAAVLAACQPGLAGHLAMGRAALEALLFASTILALRQPVSL